MTYLVIKSHDYEPHTILEYENLEDAVAEYLDTKKLRHGDSDVLLVEKLSVVSNVTVLKGNIIVMSA